MNEIDIMDIGGFKIGQAEDTKGLTGCTVYFLINSHRRELT